MTYYLGKHCCKRTELYHRLHHYQIKLVNHTKNKIKRLKEEGYEDPEEIVNHYLDEYLQYFYEDFKALINETDSYLDEI